MSSKSTKQELIQRAMGEMPKKEEELEETEDSEVVKRLREEAKEAEEKASKPKFRLGRNGRTVCLLRIYAPTLLSPSDSARRRPVGLLA